MQLYCRFHTYLLWMFIIFLSFTNIVFAEANIPYIKAEQPGLNPNLKFPTLTAYEAGIKNPGIMLNSNYVCLFAPKEKKQEAKIIFRYLVKAYDELYRIVGRHTEYKIVVYHFPEDNPNFSGGTSNCTIRYGYRNLDLGSDNEWKQYHVPHVSGYIEEMAHNFVHTTHIQFGWEMIGWSIGIKTANKVAGNPLLRKNLLETRQTQKETFKRYQLAGYVFPDDIPANLCDRIHAYLLWQCEQKYGQNFWQDFFNEVNKQQERLLAASKISDSDRNRNERYKITVECFDHLPGLNFEEMMKKSGISLVTDVKSLHPTEPGWDRKFTSGNE